MAKPTELDRRQFVVLVTAVLGTFMGAVVGLPALTYLLSPTLKSKKIEAWVPLGKLASYPIGSPTPANFTRTKINGWEKTTNSYGVYILRKNEQDLIVYSNLCTHLSCRVNWNDESKVYICPCHDGHFDIDGKVVAGPPPRSLDTFQAKVEDGNLFIYLQEV